MGDGGSSAQGSSLDAFNDRVRTPALPVSLFYGKTPSLTGDHSPAARVLRTPRSHEPACPPSPVPGPPAMGPGKAGGCGEGFPLLGGRWCLADHTKTHGVRGAGQRRAPLPVPTRRLERAGGGRRPPGGGGTVSSRRPPELCR